MKRLLAVGVLLLARPAVAGTRQVEGSKHDFSVTGPGKHRAVSETNACLFCHVSHRAGELSLSNRPDAGARHAPYESTTMVATRRAPSGASRICLSCHDGTIAVGKTRKGNIQMIGGTAPISPTSRANLGTDLRGTHPVSISPIPSESIHLPPPGDAVRLDRSGTVQCTSCHDPHDEWRDPAVGKFLVKPSGSSAICVSCHTAGGATASASTHLHLQTDSAPSAGGHGGDAASSQCAACHASHGGDRGGRLLKPEKPGDGLCLGCHGDQDARPITPELAKSSAHARDARGRHDAGEGPDAPASRRLPETSLGSLRHSSCVDCHDPHTSNATPAFAPRGAGAIAGVWGIDLDGKRVAHAQNEYEVCLKCHGDSANKPQDAEAFGLDGPKRQHKVTNLRLAFSPSAVSYHPVAAPGRTAVVPGLKGGLTSASVILCTDCHNSDSSRAAGGTGANGPHGSKYPHLLERQYLTRDRTQESPDAYALCYKCHDRGVLLSDQSSFPHLAHVRSSSTPCSACHASHGISADAALGQGGTRLVSFDLSIVRPSRTGALRHESGGPADGACALNCHNTEHGPGEKYWNY